MSRIQLDEVMMDAVFGGCCPPETANDNGKKTGWTRDECGNLLSPGQNGQGNAYGVLGKPEEPPFPPV